MKRYISALILIILASCTTDKLDVIESFPFFASLSALPRTVNQEEVVSFDLNINTERVVGSTQYFLDFVQVAGKGEMYLNGERVEENERVEISLKNELSYKVKMAGENVVEFNLYDNKGKSSATTLDLKAVLNAPEYNFTVRIEGDNDTIAVGQQPNYEIYLKQQEFYLPEQEYVVQFTVSDISVDGVLEIDGKEYRQNDWIKISYDELMQQGNILNGTFKPYAYKKGKYTIKFTCEDPAKDNKTFSRSLVVK
jgi:hypothetical protein